LGSLDVGAFSLTLNEIIRRHESLRTSFRVVNGQPTQVIAETMQLCNYANVQMCKFADSPIRPFANSQVEGGDIQKTQREAFVQRLALEAAQQPFDLARGPLLRLKLLRLSADEHVLFWMVHHIISDGLSFGVFLRELAALYQAFSTGNPSPLPALPIQYADFAVWERQWVQGEFLESRLSYWKRQLQGPLPVLDLPVDRPRPPIQTFRGAGRSLRPPKSLVEALKTLGRQEEVTLFMTLLATFQTLLHAYTGQEDILVGTPISTRRHAETEGLIGLFINTLVLRTDLSGNPSVRELLRRVRKVCLEAYAHQEVPFEKLVDALKVGRDLSRNPLFQVLFLQHALPQPIVLKTPLQGGHEGIIQRAPPWKGGFRDERAQQLPQPVAVESLATRASTEHFK